MYDFRRRIVWGINMTAIILAGGLGTRLSSVINNIPKCMAPINRIPFLSYLLNKLDKSGFKTIIMAVGYLSEYIINYYGNTYKGLKIIYSIEKEPLGTGGAIINAIQYIKDGFFFVINGDTYFDINFREMYDISKNFIIASKYLSNVSRYGKLNVDNNTLNSFTEKGLNSNGLINGGIYFINKSFLMNFNFPLKFSWENDFLHKYVSKKMFNVSLFDNNFIDIGIPEDYQLAQSFFINE
jgi:D-glycero-alpha-D-manno-heptose 1-phosphate guanylyltransferase